MKKIPVVLLLSLVSLALTMGTTWGAEEKFPTKPIKVLFGYSAGTGADLSVRALAEAASKVLGEPMVVYNKPGGGSSVALGELKTVQPDGYSIGVLATAGIINPLLFKATYNPVTDFDAIIRYATFDFGLAVKSDAPYKTFKEFVAYAQANPNKIRYSTSGNGSPGNLSMLLLGNLLNVKWIHIPFGSGGEAVAALLGGHVDCVSQNAEWKPYVLAGRLRLLAMFSEKRMETFPDVPTATELGYKVVAPTIGAFAAPKGVPQARLTILHDALHKGFDSPAFKDIMKTSEQVIAYKNGHDTQLIIKEIYEDTAKVIEKNREEMKDTKK